jgi:hypothetical protein
MTSLKRAGEASLASTLLLWARQHAPRKNVERPEQPRKGSSAPRSVTQFTPGYSRAGLQGLIGAGLLGSGVVVLTRRGSPP